MSEVLKSTLNRRLLVFKTVLLFLALFLATTPTPALAQSAMPKCDGDVAIVRISQIKPTSNLETFMKAQEAHLAWYRANGFKTNEIYSARVMVSDDKGKTMRYSDNEVMTFHVRPPAADSDPLSSKNKAGWDAYVKMYRDSSDMKAEHFICMPKTR